jgi:deoxycytidine triphosphate deaminase
MTDESPKQQTRKEIERSRLLSLIAKRPTTDPVPGPGVVLSDVIQLYVDAFDLIRPFNSENLKPASYKLTVGDECAVGGKIRSLTDETAKNIIKIPPFQVAIIKTAETINMPVFLIGRWNIQVSRAYEGLLWVGGPQVDAGYAGHLFCPIYNLSNADVELKLGDPFAVIDFEKTTPYHSGKSVPYAKGDGLPARILFEDYEPEKLESALAVLTTGRLKDIQDKIQKLEHRTQQTSEKLESRFNVFASVTLGGIGILFAVLALFVTVGDPKTIPWWAFFSVAFSFAAFLIAVGAIRKHSS